MGVLLQFRPSRPSPPRLEPCASCLGRAGDVVAGDRMFCVTCDACIRDGEIVPDSDPDGSVTYHGVTPEAEEGLEAGWRQFDEAYRR